jgi:hypothetical protein
MASGVGGDRPAPYRRRRLIGGRQLQDQLVCRQRAGNRSRYGAWYGATPPFTPTATTSRIRNYRLSTATSTAFRPPSSRRAPVTFCALGEVRAIQTYHSGRFRIAPEDVLILTPDDGASPRGITTNRSGPR